MRDFGTEPAAAIVMPAKCDQPCTVKKLIDNAAQTLTNELRYLPQGFASKQLSQPAKSYAKSVAPSILAGVPILCTDTTEGRTLLSNNRLPYSIDLAAAISV